MRKGGGVAFLILVIAVAIVLYLWASNAKSVLPTVDTARDELEEVAGPGELPNLEEMKSATAQHADELREALDGQ